MRTRVFATGLYDERTEEGHILTGEAIDHIISRLEKFLEKKFRGDYLILAENEYEGQFNSLVVGQKLAYEPLTDEECDAAVTFLGDMLAEPRPEWWFDPHEDEDDSETEA